MVTIKRDVFLSEAGPSTTLPIRSRDEGNERQTIVQREEQSRAFRQSIITNVNMPSVLPVLQLSKMEMDAGGVGLGDGAGSVHRMEHSTSGRSDGSATGSDKSCRLETPPAQMQTMQALYSKEVEKPQMPVQQVDEEAIAGFTATLEKALRASQMTMYSAYQMTPEDRQPAWATPCKQREAAKNNYDGHDGSMAEPQYSYYKGANGDSASLEIPARKHALEDYQQQLEALEDLNRRTRFQSRQTEGGIRWEPADEVPSHVYQRQLSEVEELAKSQYQAPNSSVSSDVIRRNQAASARFRQRASEPGRSQRLSPVSNSPEPYNACTPPVSGSAQGGDIPINTQSGHALQDYQMQYMLLAQQNKRRLLLARQEQESLDQEQAASRQSVADDDDFKLTPEEKAHILRRRKQQSEGPISGKTSSAHKNPGKLALDDYEWQLRVLEQRNKVQDRIGDERDMQAQKLANGNGFGTIDD